jgi:hypothetical protein
MVHPISGRSHNVGPSHPRGNWLVIDFLAQAMRLVVGIAAGLLVAQTCRVKSLADLTVFAERLGLLRVPGNREIEEVSRGNLRR